MNAILLMLGVTVVGYPLVRATDVGVESIDMLGPYVFVPALAFHSIAMTTLDGEEVLKLDLGIVGYSPLMIIIAWGVGRLAGESDPFLGAPMLATVPPNPGLVGIPLSEFTFSEVGRATAVTYLTTQNIVVYTLGVYIAPNSSDAGALDAVTKIFRLPLLHAIVIGIVTRILGVVPSVSAALMETVGLVGDTSIPMILLILDIQLAGIDVSATSRSVAPSVLKLAVVPLTGFGLVLALDFGDPAVAKVFIFEYATPAAVIPLALTIEYIDKMTVDGTTALEYLSVIIFTTTVASVDVLTVLVAVLQAGAPF